MVTKVANSIAILPTTELTLLSDGIGTYCPHTKIVKTNKRPIIFIHTII